MSQLQYNDTALKLGIIQAEEDYCDLGDTGISGNALLLKQFNRHNNNAMSKIWNWIFKASGGTYDDSNQSNLPSAVQDLSITTSKYALPTEALTVVGIEIANSSGYFYKLKPTNNKKVQRTWTLGDFGRLSGPPSEYIWKGDTILLDYIAQTAVTSGFKVFFDRGSVAFAYDATTAKPGFIADFHNAVPTLASIEYLKVHKPQSTVLVSLLSDAKQYEIDISKFYASRFKDARPARFEPYFNPQGHV